MFTSRAAVPTLALSLAAGLALARAPAPPVARATPLPGTFVVDPAGGGDFTDLQTALDAVPAESTVVVKGQWVDYRTWIRKPVTVVDLHLSTLAGYDDWDPDDAIIEVDAGAGARVTFYGLDVKLGWADDFNGTRGINVLSAGDVVISDSTIQCGSVYTSLYDYYERDGDGVVVQSASSLFIIRSTIVGGGPGSMHYDCYYSGEHGPRGDNAVQIESLAGALVVEDSVLKGGDGGTLERYCEDCTIPVPTAGMPGSGIVSSAVSYLTNSTVVAGAPGYGWRSACDPWPGVPGDPGQDIDGVRVDLPDVLHCNDAILGQPLHLKGSGYRPDELALLFFSTSIGPAVPLKQGPWLLDWPIVLIGVVSTDAAGAFALDGTVPNDPSIEGKSLVLQVFAVSQVSEPLILVPWTPH
jgi:hypothetical protein